MNSGMGMWANIIPGTFVPTMASKTRRGLLIPLDLSGHYICVVVSGMLLVSSTTTPIPGIEAPRLSNFLAGAVIYLADIVAHAVGRPVLVSGYLARNGKAMAQRFVDFHLIVF